MTDEEDDDLPGNPFLAGLFVDAGMYEETFGEQEEETIALLAEAELVLKTCQDEGIDVDQLSDAQLMDVLKEMLGEESKLRKRYLSHHADLLGRTMAHAFVQEMNNPSPFPDAEALLKKHMEPEEEE